MAIVNSRRRVLLAFLIAPLATPLVLWLGELLLDYPGRVPSGLGGSLFVNLVYALPIAYLAELILGFPAWKGFVRFDISSLFAFAACGAGIGLVPVAFFSNPKLGAAVLCALAGAISALLFRAVARTGHPHVADVSAQ
jgi:hypothetical protein